MKKKIAILGSTGSIGKTLLDILRKDPKNFDIILLTANENYKLLLKQAKEFKVKNLIITNKKKFDLINDNSINLNLNIYNNFVNLSKIFTNKVDYTMSSITGINGLEPTLKIIKYSKRIAIANKESIICGWNLINKELKKNNTDFIPVDSEHFSLWYGIQNLDINKIEKIFLTASGGPFKNLPLDKFKNITIAQALKHPNWKMGKKISIDSATMINKIYEVIEAKNIFNCSYKKIEILIHPNSYVHAILKFDTGITKIIAHDTTMRVPIFNTLYSDDNKKLKSKKIDIDKLNNLDLKKINNKRYPMIRLLNLLPSKHSLFETVIVSANDTLVQLFLENKIKFTDIQKKLFNIINKRQFINYKNKSPKTIRDIVELNNYVRLKTLKNNI
ncbi:1-deoxy-D-xylulose-5-phosphate reductoisomerase [Candidatus Pelagibacter sp.]|nr:1-deoxy-D-xylulose-5-phosphate reductoisomerase [Candidatus Pelagibacter sp.]MDA9890078.1 1-deoxy-D-xylulose-5-phosphate reductoisomerase [Candidatus Pelagibacter sp.]